MKDRRANAIQMVPVASLDRVKMRYLTEELHSEYSLLRSLIFNHEKVQGIYKKFAELERDAFIMLMTAELGAEGITGPALAKAKSTIVKIRTGMDTLLNLALDEHMQVLKLRESSIRA